MSGPERSCETAGEGGSAHHRRSAWTSRGPESPGNVPPRSTLSALSYDLSHLALSNPGGSALSETPSRIPILLHTPPTGRSLASDSRSHPYRREGLESDSILFHLEHEHRQRRRDSGQPSLSDSERKSDANIQHTRTTQSVANPVHSTLSKTAKNQDVLYARSRLEIDSVSGAEERNQHDRRDKATSKTSLGRGGVITPPIRYRPTDRCVRNLLDPPQFSSPVLSKHSSVEIVSDGGDQRQLHQETDSVSDYTPQDIVSYDEDENRSLDVSIASLRPQSPDRNKLVNELMRTRVKAYNSEGYECWFIPKKELRRVLNRDAVRRELKKKLGPGHSSREISTYADRVCEGVQREEYRHGKTTVKIRTFRKVFALLLLVESERSIKACLDDEHGFSDQDLPLRMQRQENNLPQLFRRKEKHHSPIKCFEDWPFVRLESVYNYQWQLLAPFFSPDDDGIVKHYLLQDEHILPYVLPKSHEKQAVNKSGGYGEVLMVRIHPDHHEFRNQLMCKRGFAVKKQINDEHRDLFKREANILRKFTGSYSHPHVVSLLATYEQFKKIHLLFYRAQGNLLEFWNDIFPHPDFTYENVLWLAMQCMGIADGLLRLHQILSDSSQGSQIALKPGESTV